MSDDPYTIADLVMTRFSDALSERIRVSPGDIQHVLVAQDFLDESHVCRPIEGMALEKPAGGHWTGWLLHFRGANDVLLTYRIGKHRTDCFGTVRWEADLV